MKVRYTRRALTNIDRIFRSIARDNPDAAARVVARIEGLVSRLADIPYMGEAADIPGIRRLPTSRFPYLIFYEVTADEIIIHHVRHGARRPWRGER
jgi:addiction module RelE/StbE family toxin